MADLLLTQNICSEGLRADAPAVPRRSIEAVVDTIHAHPECPRTTATEVAHRYEFFRQGHFARFYRERFGELLSETLRR